MFNFIISNIKKSFYKHLRAIQKPRVKKLITRANTVISRTAKFHPHLHYYSSNIYMLLALTHTHQVQYKKATEYCNLSIFHDPQYKLAHNIKNTATKKTKLTSKQLHKTCKESINLKRLISEFDHTLIYQNNRKKTEYHTANALFHKNETNKAITILKSYLIQNPNNSSALCDLGRMLIHNQKYKDAEKYLKKSISILQDNFIAHLWLGICNIFLCEIKNANQYMLKSIELLNKQHEYYHKNFSKQFYKRGLLHHKLGETELALNDLNRSLDLHRSNPDALLLRSKILISITNYTDAILDLEKIEQKFPNHKEAKKIKTSIKAKHQDLQNLV